MKSLWPTDIKSLLVYKAGISYEKADEIYRLLFDPHKGYISRNVASGNEIHLTGLGKFERRHRKSRVIKLALNGEEIKVPARNYPHFRTSETWKAKVR